ARPPLCSYPNGRVRVNRCANRHTPPPLKNKIGDTRKTRGLAAHGLELGLRSTGGGARRCDSSILLSENICSSMRGEKEDDDDEAVTRSMNAPLWSGVEARR